MNKNKAGTQPGAPGQRVSRRDGAGHMNPEYAQRLLDLARAGKPDDVEEAFVAADHTTDDLAEELAEAAVAAMNSGEDQLRGDLDAQVDEERGGPFLETSGNKEFAGGTDESNIPEATREPFPKTTRSGKNVD
jgi:hypothetical protein